MTDTIFHDIQLESFLIHHDEKFQPHLTQLVIDANTMNNIDCDKLTDVITHCHHGLDELFLQHQEAVLLGNFNDAMRIFERYKTLHRLHMDFENNTLISRLDELEIRGRWPASLYRQEHVKVQELIRKTEGRLRSLSKAGVFSKNLRRAVIGFLDNEKTFKGLCEHHQEREESGIFPELDRQTDTAWRRRVIQPFLTEWDDCMKGDMNVASEVAMP
jgi:hypothetical protein